MTEREALRLFCDGVERMHVMGARDYVEEYRFREFSLRELISASKGEFTTGMLAVMEAKELVKCRVEECPLHLAIHQLFYSLTWIGLELAEDEMRRGRSDRL